MYFYLVIWFVEDILLPFILLCLMIHVILYFVGRFIRVSVGNSRKKREAALFWRQINPKTTQQLTERLVPGSELAVVAL